MKHTKTVLFVLAVAAVTFFGQAASAGTIALSVDGSPSYSVTSNWSYGWQFTIDDSITVTSLGVWDRVGDGLVEEHAVGIWSMVDEQLVASATVTSGTSATLIDDFRFVDLDTSVTLPAGDYRIAAHYRYGDEVGYYVRNDSTLTAASELTNLDWSYAARGSDLTYPADQIFTSSYGQFGPNFLFVPEPTTIGLLCFGGLVMLRRRRGAA